MQGDEKKDKAIPKITIQNRDQKSCLEAKKG